MVILRGNPQDACTGPPAPGDDPWLRRDRRGLPGLAASVARLHRSRATDRENAAFSPKRRAHLLELWAGLDSPRLEHKTNPDGHHAA